MKVLSLFDGMGCGRISLDKLGKNVSKYYASEIEPNCINIVNKNYPDVINLGDVKNIDGRFVEEIDLVMGGTPCQNLSISVINRKEHNQGLDGKKSKLFYEYVRVLEIVRKTNPDVYFLLENVGSMKNEDKDIITEVLGVDPYEINSNLVSAQDRNRYYWTNIDVRELPSDKGILLKDVMLTAEEVNEIESKSRMKFWYEEDYEYHGEKEKIIATLNIKGHDILKRVYNPNGKCGTLTTCTGGNRQKKVLQEGKARKLLPVEYERLQTVPDGYTKGVSDTQRYNMLGNGWTVDVIAHILSYMEVEKNETN